MATANTVGAAVGKKASRKGAGKTKTARQPSKLETVVGWLLTIVMLVVALAPMVVALRKAFKSPEPKGIRTGRDRWTSKIEVDGMVVEGDDMVSCATEGLRARLQKKQEKEEAEFDRRVANAVKKAQQGARG